MKIIPQLRQIFNQIIKAPSSSYTRTTSEKQAVFQRLFLYLFELGKFGFLLNKFV